MYRIALKMLGGDRVKYTALMLGVAFTAFLVTFAAAYFCGFMTRGFALVSETSADVWVMAPTVDAVEQTTNLPNWALDRVRSVPDVASATPLLLGSAEVRFPNGRFQPFQVIGIDDATLLGAPALKGVDIRELRKGGAVIADEGGTEGKLLTPSQASATWPGDGLPRLGAPTRLLATGDALEVNDHRAFVIGVSSGHPRYPARPLLYMTISNARQVLLPERRQVTFVLVNAARGTDTHELAARIEKDTGLKARTADDFKSDTVNWYLINSEDVGDVMSMLTLAIAVGFGITGVMLYMFTSEHLRQYAVLGALGATPRVLMNMVFLQAGTCGVLGTGIGVGACGVAGLMLRGGDYPFRMLWFAPLAGGALVVAIGIVAAALSVRPVLKLEPAVVFAGR